MANKKKWTSVKLVNGVWTIRLQSWKHFHDYIRKVMLDYSHYVWRGDRCDNRLLIPTFERMYKGKSQGFIEKKIGEHLDNFKRATRGRRGINPPKIETENDWWALGQHYSLSTPLLDWTRSPFVALFFAFEKEKENQTSHRAIYAINPTACTRASKKINAEHSKSNAPGRPDIVEFFSPMQDENYRLVNQNGLFSRATAGKPLETWVDEKHPGLNNEGILLKILIPNQGREECLRTLNKMNINHLTLFPDLYGASSFCNFSAQLKQYL